MPRKSTSTVGSFPATALFQDDDGRHVLALVLDRTVDPVAYWAAENYAAQLPMDNPFRAQLEGALLGDDPGVALRAILERLGEDGVLPPDDRVRLWRIAHALKGDARAEPAPKPAAAKPARRKAQTKRAEPAAAAAKVEPAATAKVQPASPERAPAQAAPAPAGPTAREAPKPAAEPAAARDPQAPARLEEVSSILGALDGQRADWNAVYDFLVQECAIEPESHDGRAEALRAMTQGQAAALLEAIEAGRMLEEAPVQVGPTDGGMVDVAPPEPDPHPSDQPFQPATDPDAAEAEWGA